MKKLSTKFILLFTAVLFFVFAMLVTVVQFSARAYVEQYIQRTIVSLQEDIDSGVTEVIDEAAYLYARIVKRENADLLDALGVDSSNKQVTFKSLIDRAGLNDYYFVDAGWKDASGFYTIHGALPPPDDAFDRAEASPNTPTLGAYKDGCNILTISMKSEHTKTEGIFLIYLLESTLSDVYGLLNQEEGYSYIIRSDGYVVSHTNKHYPGKTLIYEDMFLLQSDVTYQVAETLGGARWVVVVGAMETLNERYMADCYLVSMMDYDYYYGNFNRLTYVLVAIAAGIFLIGIILAVLRAKRITKPIESLNRTIDTVIETGQESLKTANKGDEIYQLEKKYDEMIHRIFALMQKNREEMETQRKLELDALQMQINPHFLYNTLDAVVWMSKIKKEPEIERFVVNLAKFFRLSLHKGDKFISVWDEVKIIKHYLAIEQIRFPDKVQVKFEIEEEIKRYKTLKLILQPVVENALKHAFFDRTGTITVRAYGKDGDIIFEVEDDGIGFDVPVDILQIKHQTKSPDGGYGIYNVHERIRLEYGESYGLTISSEKGKGTLVVIRLEKKI